MLFKKISPPWQLSFQHLSIIHTPPYHHQTTLVLSSQTNLAFLEQVLNFIIICLHPPLLCCLPECEQETGGVISWGESWKACKIAVGGLACTGYQATLFCLCVLLMSHWLVHRSAKGSSAVPCSFFSSSYTRYHSKERLKRSRMQQPCSLRALCLPFKENFYLNLFC